MNSFPFRLFVWFWGRKEIARRMLQYVSSLDLFCLNEYFNNGRPRENGSGMYIYESRMWRKKKVESPPSNDKRSGNNEFSRRSHLSKFSPSCCYYGVISLRTSQPTKSREVSVLHSSASHGAEFFVEFDT